MNKRIGVVGSLAAIAFVITGLAQGCQPPGSTTSGNPLVSLKFANYDPSAKARTQNVGAQSVSNLTMCFKRLRLKFDVSGMLEDNIDLTLGELTIDSTGTDLGTVSIPQGTYTRIEFDLDDACGTGKSLNITNAQGTFAIGDHLTIRFDGSFTVSENSSTLSMQIQQIVSALSGVSYAYDLKNAAESVAGSF
jgi:hypothetical protein